MKKCCKAMVVVVALLVTQPACCGIGSGFSKIWDGTKDIASGTWYAVSSPFRSKKDDEKIKKDVRAKKQNKRKK